MINCEVNIDRFEKLYGEFIASREGADRLLEFIRKSDFYTAPASTKYHLAEKGGLLQHSLNVFDCLYDKTVSNTVWQKVLAKYSEETIAIVSLLHDICKTYFYTTELKNQKIYDEKVVAGADPKSVKHDAKGDYIWDLVPAYGYDNKFPIGHGAKSVFFIQQFIKLSMEEIACIYWHMGAYTGENTWKELNEAYNKYPLALALHEADMESTYLLEKE